MQSPVLFQRILLRRLLLPLIILAGAATAARAGVPEGGFSLAADALPAGWQAGESGIERTEPAAEPAVLLAGEEDWNDYTAETQVTLGGAEVGSEAGLVLQAESATDYLVFSLAARKSGPYAILRYQNAELPLTGDQAWLEGLDLTQPHTLRADVHGTAVMGYVDGEPVVSFDFLGTPPADCGTWPLWEDDPDQGQVGLMSVGAAARFSGLTVTPLRDFAHIITPQSGRRDASGMMLPRQSYDKVLRDLTAWAARSQEVIDTSLAPESVRHLPPYILSMFMRSDDQLWMTLNEFAFNHSLYICGAVTHYLYSGNDDILDEARTLADWHIANRSPADWALPYMPMSAGTYGPDGTIQTVEWGIEIDKSAYMGLAFLRLYAVTDEPRYLDAALKIAATLRPLQKEDGSWPFRVNAETGEVEVDYACSQLFHSWFFEQLAKVSGEPEDLERSRRAFQWVLENPVKTNKWIGLYGDVPSDSATYDQWIAQETAMMLLDQRDEYPEAVEIAEGILAWIQEHLMVPCGFHEGIPGLIEQATFIVVLTHHQARLAEMYAKLYEATGKPEYRIKALETANSTTWCQMSDGKVRQGLGYFAIACPILLSFNDQFCRIMSALPETAPAGENHLLQTTGLLKSVDYGENRLGYHAIGGGEETLVVQGAPTRVATADNAELPRIEEWFSDDTGWWYDDEQKLMKIRREGPSIQIEFAPAE
ncbi:MAG TPA: hypothetical protein PK847_11760 [Candidatus Sumerlaeota bacterium]|nr:hypothetical protein [Candidatus Sumerlaeota bacterium]